MANTVGDHRPQILQGDFARDQWEGRVELAALFRPADFVKPEARSTLRPHPGGGGARGVVNQGPGGGGRHHHHRGPPHSPRSRGCRHQSPRRPPEDRRRRGRVPGPSPPEKKEGTSRYLLWFKKTPIHRSRLGRRDGNLPALIVKPLSHAFLRTRSSLFLEQTRVGVSFRSDHKNIHIRIQSFHSIV